MKYPRLPRSLDKRVKLNKNQIKIIKILVEKGILKKDIAKEFKVSMVTIRYWLSTPKQRKEKMKRQWALRKKKDLSLTGKLKRRKRQEKSIRRKKKLVPEVRKYIMLNTKKYRKNNL